MEESTAIEQPAAEVDLRSQVEATYDDLSIDVTEGIEEDDPIVAESTETPEVQDEVTETPENQEEQEAKEEPTTELLSAPEHWPIEAREMFDKLGKGELEATEAQSWLLERHKAMEGDYTRKMQEVAPLRNDFGDFYSHYADQIAGLKQQGIQPAQYMSQLAEADMLLARDPIAGIQHVAQLYGIDLGEAAQAPQQDPQIMQLNQELNQLRSEIAQRDQGVTEQRFNEAQNQVTAFAEAKDEAGNPAHPYFNDVAQDMAVKAGYLKQQGQTPDLQQLYEEAVWANPTIRAKLQAEQSAAQKKEAEERARAEAAKARKASESISTDGGSSPNAKLSLREQLEQNWSG